MGVLISHVIFVTPVAAGFLQIWDNRHVVKNVLMDDTVITKIYMHDQSTLGNLLQLFIG